MSERKALAYIKVLLRCIYIIIIILSWNDIYGSLQ